ncbi:16S rRNA (adenine(1518)-N(6)/adenine(1519)-N(6))-dimethyltransferase RsmA [Catenovulum sp. 2E275]|uniref:16S rRNA (adenine(1518)-N(6)/adenine(1519)-N(6))- dimethyltransferase RsmA n=1 Tax=Catenovulum sp. 2E275 TaxID=2980497 RepID=UPI0021D05AF6|nr:16S rRNA (adenine(1518)-N(6)/adenine(1519)-N(6))-dimethyltransferase RsmA [Catenovulum sp. 2E275]MCU4675087.1 16S rRNA (adenine(1518)-N(6)/adenine(1519)-N(6))-dimethyltransferase RsmA [Catenovulum sp. 2E275]
MTDKVHLGHRARKRFGQNFLTDDYIIGEIVDAIAPDDNFVMVEIGPGLGALTFPVMEQVEHLNVVELDRDLVQRFEEDQLLKRKLTVYQADAMKFDFAQLITGDKKMKLFGNLPYNISTPLLFHLFEFCDQISDMHFMLQKEVVDRMCAEPGSKAFGKLSVMTQYYCDAEPVVAVDPNCFTPAPKVESAVVRLMPKQVRADVDTKTLEKVASAAFNQRRKTIRNSLKDVLDVADFETLGLNPTLRAESLTLDEFIAIAQFVSQK